MCCSGILYESFIHPITIISGLPSAGIGALLTLMAFKMDLSVIAMIGIVMLVGIVKKNAIMMIDFAIERRQVGLSAEAAIREAALLRFRPIMMTTFAAIFGALPIALGHGAGAELRQPLGVSVVGGLVLSQLLTLYITPVVYIYLDRVDRMLKRRLEPQLEEVPEHPERPKVDGGGIAVSIILRGFWRGSCCVSPAGPEKPHETNAVSSHCSFCCQRRPTRGLRPGRSGRSAP